MPDPSVFVGPPEGLAIAPRCLTATGLWRAVLNARTAWAQERHLPQRGLEPIARATLLDALEAYVESLDARGYPVPYALRDELRLRRLTCGARQHVYAQRTTREEVGHDHPVR